jgi:hypothetical protein
MRSLRRLGLGLDPPQFAIVNSLFFVGEQGAWYDPSDLSTMYQTNAAVTPAVVGSTVGRIEDKSGNGNHATQATAASRPILRQDAGGLYYLEFDGTDDFLVTGAIDFSASDEMSVFVGLRKSSDAATGVLVELSADVASNNGTFVIFVPSGATTTVRLKGKGTLPAAGANANVTSAAAPTTFIATGQVDISNDVTSLSLDGGTPNVNSSDLGTGNFGAAYPIYIGSRGGTTLPFIGSIYGFIVRSALTAAGTLDSTEAYVAAKTGVTL